MKSKPGNFIPTGNTAVCETHFDGSCFDRNLFAEMMSPDSKKTKLKATVIPTIFIHIPGKRRTHRDPSNWQTSKYREMDVEQILTEATEPEVNSVEMDSHREPPQTPIMHESGPSNRLFNITPTEP